MDWMSCLREAIVKRVAPEPDTAASLLRTSANKAFSSGALTLSEETAASKISLSYDAVRELLEALALLKGFKVYNHACYAGFLSEVLLQRDIAEEFDEVRKLRNDINYYGKDVSLAEARDALRRLSALLDGLTKLLPK